VNRKFIALTVLAVMVSVLVLTGVSCKGAVTSVETVAATTAAAETTVAETAATTEAESVVAEKTYNIGYTSVDTTLQWLVSYFDEFNKLFATKPNYVINLQDCGYDTAKQIGHFDQFIASKVDLICVFPNDTAALVPSFQKSNEAGIPVFATMDQPGKEAYDYIIGSSGLDNRNCGYNVAVIMSKLLNGEGKVGLITPPVGTPSEIDFSEGFAEGLKAVGSKIVIIDKQPGDWDPVKSAAAVEDMITKYPDIKGFYPQDGFMASAVINKLKEMGKKPGDYAIVTNGGTIAMHQAIEEGWCQADVDQSPKLCAQQDFLLIQDFLVNGYIPFRSFIKQAIITKDNYKDFPGSW
jgi:ribose transport system substrate-binding protein